MTAVELLCKIAESCSRAEDTAFWILMSAASRLNGYLPENQPTAEGRDLCAESTVAHYFPEGV